ncbi:5'-nucleotidase SurE [Geodia barretti]|uniref:5'-nucleotidase SurE n=1 Tax=Geodia barretti TaxID=519541 RepID=A0AA35SDW4_GEOBA|nr:5'-nucleotidase SurE [Geodia barretti]
MKILLTNDDGIHASGIWAAARTLAEVGEVAVVAPDREQSGVGASMTLHSPLFVHSVPAEHAWAVQGTPADACILALENLVTPKPDLVVSGINRGSNLGWDVIVSGTVGAAVQGWVRGYPTIAISVGSVQAPRYQLAAQVVAHLARRLADAPEVSPAYFLNVNVPNEPADQIAGVKVTRLGGRAYGESVRSEESFGHRRYWISRNRPVLAGGDGTDIDASKSKYIGITPMGMAFSTTDERVEMVQGLVEGLPSGCRRRLTSPASGPHRRRRRLRTPPRFARRRLSGGADWIAALVDPSLASSS